jgi:hypothetical protein
MKQTKMPKRAHTPIFEFSSLSGQSCIDLSKITNILYQTPRCVYNPEEPDLWPVQITFHDGQRQIYYFHSQDDVIDFSDSAMQYMRY